MNRFNNSLSSRGAVWIIDTTSEGFMNNIQTYQFSLDVSTETATRAILRTGSVHPSARAVSVGFDAMRLSRLLRCQEVLHTPQYTQCTRRKFKLLIGSSLKVRAL